jgi:ATP-dependent DNA ligase
VIQHGVVGNDLFWAACQMGLEGIVSKRRDRPYQGGRSKYWVKVKNRKHPSDEPRDGDVSVGVEELGHRRIKKYVANLVAIGDIFIDLIDRAEVARKNRGDVKYRQL